MAEVIDFFTGAPVLVEVESDWVDNFMENEGWDFLNEVQELASAADEDEFRQKLADIKERVERWALT